MRLYSCFRFRPTMATAVAVSLALSGGVACSSSAPLPGTPSNDAGGSVDSAGPYVPPVEVADDAGPPLDASPPLVDAADASSPPTPPSFVSNTPGAVVVDVGTPPTPNLVLLSSNFVQSQSGTQVFQEWFGEVQNVGTTTVCQVSVDLSYAGASGVVVAPNRTYADADPYVMTGSALIMPCIAPGKIGSFYQNGFAPTMASTSAITSIDVSFHPATYPGTSPAVDAPLVSAKTAPIVGGYGITGTLTGEVDTVHNIGIRAYPRDPTGLVLKQLTGTDLGTLAPGATYSFSTASISTAFTQYRLYVDYLAGAGQRPMFPVAAGDDVAAKAAAVEAARRESQRETEARGAMKSAD